MRFLRLSELQIDSLVFSGAFAKKLKDERTRERAQSIQEWGLLMPPVVRWKTKEVIDGEDRLAGLKHNGHTRALCLVVECTNDEVKIARLESELQRRHLSAAERLTLQGELMLILEQFERRKATEQRIRDPDYQYAKGERAFKEKARRAIAERLNVTEEAVKKRMERARKKLREDDALSPKHEPRFFGMVVTEEFNERVDMGKRAFRKLENKMQATRNAIKDVERAGVGMPLERMKRIHDMAEELYSYIRASIPVGLCPYCKGIPAVCRKCISCYGSALLFANQEDGILKELTDTKNPCIYLDGQFKPVAGYMDPTEASNGMDGDVSEGDEPSSAGSDGANGAGAEESPLDFL